MLYWQKLNPFGRCNQSECYKITNSIGLKKSTINLYLKVLVGVIPAGVIGVLFDDVIEKYKNKDTKIGIDISHWQGNINYKNVKKAGGCFYDTD